MESKERMKKELIKAIKTKDNIARDVIEFFFFFF